MDTTLHANRFRGLGAGLLVAASGLLSACTTAPTAQPRRPPEPVEPPQRVFFYPQQGQSPEQQDRDRYECFNWAVRQTGFDPSRRPLPRETREAVVPAPSSGLAPFAGAVAGAMLGAAVAGPGHTGQGAVVGAAAGGLLGAAAEQSAQAEAERINQARASRDSGRFTREMSDYRRAMTACLEGRGYSVR